MTEQLPPDVIAQLTGMDPAITPELVATSWALLKPFHDKVGYTAPKIDRDLAYGDHERQRLDVHTAGLIDGRGGARCSCSCTAAASPAATSTWPGARCTTTSAPGPSATAGSASRSPTASRPSTPGRPARRTSPPPSQWVRDNIASYGGDPSRIVVAGHSAGCVHVASYLAGQGGGTLDGIRGAGLLSGFYQIADGAERGEPELSYFGDRPSAEVNTLPGLLDSEVPLIFAIAERDPRFSQGQIAGLTAAWFARKGTVPQVIWSEGHNHISQIGSVGVDDLALGAQLARFVNRVTQSRARKDPDHAPSQDPR